jgi:serine/threonine-protein kinase
VQVLDDDAGEPVTFGRYEPLFKIASGGMAAVYAARIRGEAGFQKLVALKRMLPNLAEDDRFVTMFLDEARLAANVSSPHVVATMDLGRASDGSLYLVMDLVVGVTLSHLLRSAGLARRQLPLPIALEIISEAAAGLHDAHEARAPTGDALHIVHRDVSPQNILVGVDGRARLTDFGVARALQRLTQTSAGELKGKFSYFAPEQTRPNAVVDRRVDVFAMGIVAWEALTARKLFAGDNAAETIDLVRTMPIPPVRAVRKDVPEDVSHVIAAALERDPARRLPTAGAMAQGLRTAMRELAVPSKDDVGALVRDLGGKQLSKLVADIRRAAAVGDTEPFIDLHTVDLLDSVTTTPHGSVQKSGVVAAAAAGEPPSRPSAAVPPPPPRVEPSGVTPPARSRVPLLAVAGAIVLGAVGTGAWWAGHNAAPPAGATTTPAPPPPIAADPTPAPAVEAVTPFEAPIDDSADPTEPAARNAPRPFRRHGGPAVTARTEPAPTTMIEPAVTAMVEPVVADRVEPVVAPMTEPVVARTDPPPPPTMTTSTMTAPTEMRTGIARPEDWDR